LAASRAVLAGIRATSREGFARCGAAGRSCGVRPPPGAWRLSLYRGAALPTASDLAATPVSVLAVQACGDADLSNFGIFGSGERRLVFDRLIGHTWLRPCTGSAS
jgi:Uncharacterized protein conserved in bacteria (DUF2252)